MGSERRRRPTQTDVARQANVSQSTVSQVLNNNLLIAVPEETRQRVMDAATQLGYVPDYAARSLRTRKTSTIASIIPDITNPFYPTLVRGIQDIAEQHGYDLVTYNTDGLAEKERRAIRALQHGRADGTVVVLFHATARDLLPLIDLGISVVRIEATPKAPGPRPLDSLYVDNAAAAASAAEYLVQRGHRRIGAITSDVGPGRIRLEGYRAALAPHGIQLDAPLVCYGDFSFESGADCVRQLLGVEPRPSAVLIANDMMALGALAAVQAAGLRVPEDLAIVGFDDILPASLVTPALTTVSLSQAQIGRRAAAMLFERMEDNLDEGGRCEAIAAHLEIRRSA